MKRFENYRAAGALLLQFGFCQCWSLLSDFGFAVSHLASVQNTHSPHFSSTQRHFTDMIKYASLIFVYCLVWLVEGLSTSLKFIMINNNCLRNRCPMSRLAVGRQVNINQLRERVRVRYCRMCLVYPLPFRVKEWTNGFRNQLSFCPPPPSTSTCIVN